MRAPKLANFKPRHDVDSAEARYLDLAATDAALATIERWSDVDRTAIGDRLFEVCGAFRWQSLVNAGPTERAALSTSAAHLQGAISLIRSEIEGHATPFEARGGKGDRAAAVLLSDEMDDDLELECWIEQCRGAERVLARLEGHFDALRARWTPEKSPAGRRRPKMAFGQFCYQTARIYAEAIGTAPKDVAVSVGAKEQTATRFIRAASEILLDRNVEPSEIVSAYRSTAKLFS